MFQGNWPCSKCGKAITELPFEPDPARLGQILCRDCHREKSDSRGPRQSFGGGERKMFQGSWPCSSCGKTITELPFEPNPARLGQILCRDCHRAKREANNY